MSGLKKPFSGRLVRLLLITKTRTIVKDFAGVAQEVDLSVGFVFTPVGKFKKNFPTFPHRRKEEECVKKCHVGKKKTKKKQKKLEEEEEDHLHHT